jgi:hypothetical protein
MVRKPWSRMVRRNACFRIQSFGICRAAVPFARATSLSWFLGVRLTLILGTIQEPRKDPADFSFLAWLLAFRSPRASAMLAWRIHH